MRVAKAVTLTGEERTTFVEMVAWAKHARTACATRQHRFGGGRRKAERTKSPTSLDATDAPVGTWRNRFASKRLEGIQKDAPRGGTQTDSARCRGCGNRSQDNSGKTRRRHALVHSIAGKGDEHQRFDGSQSMARQRVEAALGQDVQGLERSAIRRKTGRCGRIVFESAGTCVGDFVRRKEPNSGSRPHARRVCRCFPDDLAHSRTITSETGRRHCLRASKWRKARSLRSVCRDIAIKSG